MDNVISCEVCGSVYSFGEDAGCDDCCYDDVPDHSSEQFSDESK
ncbi:hypothetical protein [Paenibacillus sp. SI8]